MHMKSLGVQRYILAASICAQASVSNLMLSYPEISLSALKFNTHLHTHSPASHFDVPEDILSTMVRVASSVASSVSEVGVNYSFRKMVDVYSATGTFADW